MAFNITIIIDDPIWKNQLVEIENNCKNTIEDAMKFIEEAPKNIGVSILLTSDSEIQQMNNQFRFKDKPTNVLSFPSNENDYLGDIALGWGVITEEAKSQNKKLTDHIKHLLIHGLLHLFGYDHIDDQDAEIMEALEIKILASMNINNPYLENM